jgi:hypothetical protein
VPGSSAYEIDLPHTLYWDWIDEPPVSSFDVKHVVAAGTPISDLSFGFGYSILVAEIIQRGLPLTLVPEPSSLAIVAFSVVGLSFIRRCRR